MDCKSMLNNISVYEKKADRYLSQYPIFLQAEHKTGIKKTNLIAFAASFLLSLGIFFMAPVIVTSLALFVFPAFATMLALEKHDKRQDTQWISYWMIVSLTYIFETIAGGEINKWVVHPLYRMLKIAAFAWLYLPQTQGALLAFDLVLNPFAQQVKTFMKSYSCCLGSSCSKSPASEIKAAINKAETIVEKKLASASATEPTKRSSPPAEQ